MAVTTVETIRTAILTRMASILTGWTQIKYVWNIEQNVFQGSDSRFGVRVSSGTEVQGTTCHYMVEQVFPLVLVKGYVTATNDDSNITNVIDDLMEAAHDLYKSISYDKAGTDPTVVVRASDLSIDEPVIYNSQKIVELVANITFTYRVRTS